MLENEFGGGSGNLECGLEANLEWIHGVWGGWERILGVNGSRIDDMTGVFEVWFWGTILVKVWEIRVENGRECRIR